MEQMSPYPPPPPQPRRRSRWWIPLVLFLGFGLFGFIFLIIGLVTLIGGPFAEKPVEIKAGSVLELRVNGSLNENQRTAPLAVLGSETQSASFLDLLNGLQRAKTDDRIIGLYYRSGGLSCGFAKATEIRDALLDFKQSGKFFHAFIDVGGELDYYFASAADSIFMPTEGMLELNGFAIEDIFWKESLEKVGIEFYVEAFEEFKSAGESYSRTGFSAPARQSLRALLQQRQHTMLDAIAQGRHLEKEAAAAALNRGIYTADSLQALGFIDAIRSEGTVQEHFKRRPTPADSVSKKAPLVTMGGYIHSPEKGKQEVVENRQIAVIYASGMILPGEGDATPILEEAVVASRSYARYLRQAREDKRIKAIILRIDSPGGSVMAADEIWEEVVKTRRVKPIYASMSDVAASGGYYIAMGCDTIIAHPQSITGSIGVVSTIPNVSKMLGKIGAHVDTLKSTEGALFLNPLLRFSAADQKKFHQLSASIYQRFVERVATSRGKTFEQARQLARGRVWTGEAAHDYGLIDTLGGYRTALNIAKRRIGIAPDQKVRLRVYPPPQEPWDALKKLFEQLTKEDSGMGSRTAWNASAGSLAAALPMWPLLPAPVREQLNYLLILQRLGQREPVLAALPSISPLQIR